MMLMYLVTTELDPREDHGKAGDLLSDVGEDVEAKFGRHQNAVGVFRALLGLELIGAVRRAD